MKRHRTTARSILPVILGLAAGVAVQTAGAVPVQAELGGTTLPAGDPGVNVPPEPPAATAPAPATPKPKGPVKAKNRLIFPVVGPVQYTDDFGDPRPQGRHEGNDIMAPKRSLAVAVADGTVKFGRTGGSAGCYLYLYAKNKTYYLYIHLNNDLTTGNDNRGKCGPGVSYAKGLKDGQKVKEGQLLGYVGDSGDANGVASHLHFEVHPKGGRAVSPYPYLNRAYRLLFAAARGSTFTLSLAGSLGTAKTAKLQVRVKNLLQYPVGFRFPGVNRLIQLAMPSTTLVEKKVGSDTRTVATPSTVLKKKAPVQVFTAPARVTLAAQMGIPGAISTNRVLVR